MKRLHGVSLAVVTAAALVACGGGGGGESATVSDTASAIVPADNGSAATQPVAPTTNTPPTTTTTTPPPVASTTPAVSTGVAVQAGVAVTGTAAFGAPLEGAQVSVMDANGTVRRATANAAGTYTISVAGPGPAAADDGQRPLGGRGALTYRALVATAPQAAAAR